MSEGRRAEVMIQGYVFTGTVVVYDETETAIRLDSGELVSSKGGQIAWRPLPEETPSEPLEERSAEIERLRDEVDRLKAENSHVVKVLELIPDGGCGVIGRRGGEFSLIGWSSGYEPEK